MPPVRDRNGAGKGTPADRKNAPAAATAVAGGPAPDAGGKLHDAVTAALRAAEQTPDDISAWDRLEEAAIEHESQPAAADAYRRAMRQQHPPGLLMELGERAVRFHQEWLADRPASLIDILQRV